MELWLFYAAGAAVFAALVTILAKIGIKDVESNLATAIRTMVVLVFAWLMVFLVGSQNQIFHADARTWTFLILSGLATGGSWLCYFRALKMGAVKRVAPLKKSSTILTMILAFIFLGEPIGVFTIIGMVLMAIGTFLMVEPSAKKKSEEAENSKNHGWLFFGIIAAVFASLTAILATIGFQYIDASLGTAIRTMAVVPISWLMVLLTRKKNTPPSAISKKSWLFLVLSGIATGASWLLFFRALQLGPASHVVPIDKLSIVLTMLFARIFLRETFSKRNLIGLALLTVGTLIVAGIFF
ncbi:MAG: EamA family transporter [Defluviitaleaceae bacterium]|nr:EamA family transporter [Defluviitaleaceae bacterium]MCL2262037.1 EamA family transporter [Defluviitaleaceae bacterium]